MNGFDEFDGEDVTAPADPKAARRGRGIYLLPSILTLGSLLCGYYAIWTTFKGTMADLDNAAKAIGLAIVFDMLDGFIARITHTDSEVGKQFDSLADVISFGVAPALLAFAWGVSGLLVTSAPEGLQVYRLGWLVGFAFLLCCAWRLARFNIQGMAPERSRYFVGLPTPAAAGMIAAMVHAVKYPLDTWWVSLLWLGLVLALAVLMASNVRYVGFKEILWQKRHSSLSFILMGLLIAAIVLYSEVVLLTIASLYLLSGMVSRLVRLMRHRLTSHPTNVNTNVNS
ncbi:MAG TPA: CDP-diacylglycerol--serine O-phosphatidyltransferase [Candidatus Dormibacteraeota bacterium]|nr:CDP-diacylglycerol--serine O-phosphatidyltransferase [Candidatus Dormibacteraeota bacterium]